jgi:hypothetical protein
MEIRGRQYTAAQGIVTHTGAGTPTEVIAGVSGKTLHLNYISISFSDMPTAARTGKLTDGSGGTAFFHQELAANNASQSHTLDFGEFGLTLTEGNGLFVETDNADFDLTVAALGFYK